MCKKLLLIFIIFLLIGLIMPAFAGVSVVYTDTKPVSKRACDAYGHWIGLGDSTLVMAQMSYRGYRRGVHEIQWRNGCYWAGDFKLRPYQAQKLKVPLVVKS